MFENIGRLFKRMIKTEPKELDVTTTRDSKETAKERLHLVLMQDRANVSADFLELMKQEIIDVIKKYIEVDEETIDVRLTTKTNEDGTTGTPSLYANIPILNIRNDMKVENFNFSLQSDGSIIAQKIEDTEENVEKVIDLDELDSVKENVEEEYIDSVTSENFEDSENKFEENVSEFESKVVEENDFSKIEERQELLKSEIIPAINNIVSEEADKKAENEEKSEEIIENKENEKEVNEDVEEVQENVEDDNTKLEEKEQQNVDDSNEEKAETEPRTQPITELKKSCKRGRPKKDANKKSVKTSKTTKKKAKDNDKIDDEEDDDVTFDDLLKAAEEEDRRIAEQKKKEGE